MSARELSEFLKLVLRFRIGWSWKFKKFGTENSACEILGLENGNNSHVWIRGNLIWKL